MFFWPNIPTIIDMVVVLTYFTYLIFTWKTLSFDWYDIIFGH